MSAMLDNKVCVVTGAAGGLCSAMTGTLLEHGARVALLGRTREKLVSLSESLAKRGYPETIAVEADVCDIASLEKARETIRERLGSPFLLLNGAGGNIAGATSPATHVPADGSGLDGTFFGLDMSAFSAVTDINFTGTVNACRVFGHDMAENNEGCIVNVSSMAAIRPLTRVGAYAASKAAVENFTRWLAVHLVNRNIRVNAIAPGFFATEQNRALLYEKDGVTLTARAEKIVAATPMGRFGEAGELESALEFLINPRSTFVTGVVIPVDGGFSAFSGV